MVEERVPASPFGSFLFPRIFQASRLSLQPTKLVVAFWGLTAIGLTGWLMDFSQTVVLASPGKTTGIHGKPVTPAQSTELDVYVQSGVSVPDFIEATRAQGHRTGVFRTLWRFGAEQFHKGLYAIFALDSRGVLDSARDSFRALMWAFRYHPVYSVVFFTVVLAVMSLAGGALCRIAALEFAGAERPELRRALRFSIRRFASLFLAPLTPIVVIFGFGLVFIALLGLLGNVRVVGELIVGLSLPLAVPVAGFIVVFLAGTAAGLNLMFPAVAYEDADCFDAIGRSFSYVYTALWRLGFYTLVAVVYGAICYVIVRFFAFLLLWVIYRFLQIGFLGQNEKLLAIWSGPAFGNFFGVAPPVPDTWSMWLAFWLVRLWVLVVLGLVASFVISFYFSAHTIIYALLRNRVDKTPLEEVYISSDEPALGTTRAGMAAGATTSEPQSRIQSDSGTAVGTSE